MKRENWRPLPGHLSGLLCCRHGHPVARAGLFWSQISRGFPSVVESEAWLMTQKSHLALLTGRHFPQLSFLAHWRSHKGCSD